MSSGFDARRSILYVPGGSLYWVVSKVGSGRRCFGELAFLGSFVVVGKMVGGVGVLPAIVCIEWVIVCSFGCGGRLGFVGGDSCGIAFAEVGVAG